MEWFETDGDLNVCVLSRGDLVKAKKAAGRPRDLDDLEHIRWIPTCYLPPLLDFIDALYCAVPKKYLHITAFTLKIHSIFVSEVYPPGFRILLDKAIAWFCIAPAVSYPKWSGWVIYGLWHKTIEKPKVRCLFYSFYNHVLYEFLKIIIKNKG